MNLARNIMKSSSYLNILTVILTLAVISATPALASTCIGNNFEQQMPVDGVQTPSVNILGDSEVNEGEALELTAYEWVDTANGGSAFFYWCADSGDFESDEGADFRTIRFVAPYVSADETVSVRAKVGDSLGYVARATLIVTVLNVSDDDPDDPDNPPEDPDNPDNPDNPDIPEIPDDTPHEIDIICPYPAYDECNNLCNGNYHVAGGDLTIKWVDDTRTSVEAEVTSLDVYYSIAGGEWVAIEKGVIPNNTRLDTYEWQVAPDFVHRDVKIRIIGHYDTGGMGQGFSEPFRITDGSSSTVTVSEPASGSVYDVGQPVEIRWSSSPYEVERVDLKFMPAGEPIAKLVGEGLKSGSYTWYPTKHDLTDKGQIQVTVWTTNCAEGEARSTGYFEIRNAHDPSSPWERAERIFTKPTRPRPNPSWESNGWIQDLKFPDVLVDENGNIHAVATFQDSIKETTSVAMGVYEEYESGIYYIKGNGGNWQSQEQATSYPPLTKNAYLSQHYFAARPSLAIDHSGLPHIAYEYEGTNERRDIHYVGKTAGGWSQYENLSNSPARSTLPKIAVDQDDKVYVFWEEEGQGIRYKVKGDGGAWSSATVPPITTEPFDIATDDQNVLHLVARGSGGYFHTRLENGVWSSPEAFTATTGFWDVRIHLTGDTIYIAGMYGSEFHLFKNISGIWEPPEINAWPEGTSKTFPWVDMGGNIHVIYKNNSREPVERMNDGSGWSDYTVISTDSVRDWYSAHGNGNILAAAWDGWFDGSRYDVFLSYSEMPDFPPNVASFEGKAVSDDDPLTVQFALNVRSGEGITGYKFIFGDGESLDTNEPTATHTFPGTGTYTATVVVTDEKGGTGTVSADITVMEAGYSLDNAVFSASGTIHEGGVVHHDVPITKYDLAPIMFKVTWPGSDLDLEITTPGGLKLSPASDAVEVYYEGATQEYWIVNRTEPGIWGMDIIGVEVDPAGEPYQFTVTVNETSEAPDGDADEDGMKDEWERTHFGSILPDGTGDADEDGLSDLEEHNTGTDPTNMDTDGDGLADGWEVAYEMDPLVEGDELEDPDGDGHLNFREYGANTNPLDANSFPPEPEEVMKITGAAVVISENYAIIGDSVFKRHGQKWIEHQKLIVTSEYGGISSISADYAIGGSGKTSADIFKREGDTWVQQQRLIINTAGWESSEIRSLSICENYAAIGFETGKWKYGFGFFMNYVAYVFKKEGDVWVEQQKLTAGDETSNYFGQSVSISDNYLVIGAPLSNSAYIFKREGDTWVEKQKLLPSDGGGWLGRSVSMSGDYVIIGSPYNSENGYHSGSAYVFKREGDIWIQQDKLIANDGEEKDDFGRSVSISGDYAIMGAICDNENGYDSGSAYIFKRNGSDWVELEKLTASDGAVKDFFGINVGISGGYAIVGSRAGTYFYTNFTDDDLDYDGMKDDWEREHFGDLSHDGTADGDTDGLSDLEEHDNATDPANADTDGDTMNDGWEVGYELNPLDETDALEDPDGDGYSNLQEYDGETDPTDPESFPNPNIGEISLTPSAYNFGESETGTTSETTFSISNTGTGDLTPGTITITGTDAPDFTITADNCSGQTLSPESECTVTVTFSPTSPGAKQAELSIPSDDPDTPFLSLPLSGTAVKPLPLVDLTAASQTVTEDIGTVTITATLSFKTDQAVTVPYTLTGTATANGTDHDLSDGTITIPAGEQSGTATFNVIFDIFDEPDENIIVTMNDPVNALSGPVTTHTVVIEGNTPFDFIAGVFTTGDSGLIGIEWLYDGGAYQGQFGIFSLSEMGAFLSDPAAFKAEAVTRVLSDSEDGHLVFSDPEEGARFSGSLGESHNWNSGPYNEEKFFEMRPNDRFAAILIPNATFEDVHSDPGTTDPNKRPLFSLASSNPEHGMYLGQITDLNGLGHAFVYEDILFSDTSDRDYNDFIFQVSGARGDAPPLDEWIDPEEDWRDSELGELMVTYIDEAEEALWKTVAFTADPHGTISGGISQTVEVGQNCTPVTAVPKEGYTFTGWTGDHTGTENPLTVISVSDHLYISANFEIMEYQVIFKAGTGGSLTGETSQQVNHGDGCTQITAVPDDGYHFSHWSGDYEGDENPLTLGRVTADMNVTANFEVSEYTVTFAAETGGTVTGQTSQKVTHGKDCAEVTAVPDTGYSFAFWSGGHIGTDNPLTLGNVTGDMTVTANFVVQEYEVTFTAGPGGKLTGETSQSVRHGDDCTPVTVIPETGSSFLGWIGDHSGTGNPLTLTGITGDMTVTASFGISEYTVNIIAGENGDVVGETSQIVEHGSDASAVTAEPADGYRFGGWSGDYTGTENPLTLEEITRDCTIHAVFSELGQYTVITRVSGNGTVDPSGNVAVTEGDDQTFSVTPGDDAVISHIEADGVSVTEEIVADDSAPASYTFTAVESDHILKVTFTTIGDVNGDDVVGLADAILALKILAGLSVDSVSPKADVNGDQKIGLGEAIHALQIAAELD